MDFVFGLPKDSEGNTGIVVFVDRLSKMAHLAAVPDSIDTEGTAKLFIERVNRVINDIYAVFALIRLCVGAPCSLLLNLR